MFEMRAALVQHYDVGATGRFGRFGRAIPELLQMPNGYGPLQFPGMSGLKTPTTSSLTHSPRMVGSAEWPIFGLIHRDTDHRLEDDRDAQSG